LKAEYSIFEIYKVFKVVGCKTWVPAL
jgi:hypothetical protein